MRYDQNPRYTNESGTIPRRPDKTQLLELFRQRLHPTLEQQPIPERFTDVKLGAHDEENPLPVSEYKDLIVDTIAHNQVTIIVAETGAGKSTQVPQYLLEAGYTVTLTQPRRLAANMLSERIGDEIAEAFDDPEQKRLVGLHTAERNTITEDTRIAVVTDGLRLVQELNDRGDVENEILIIDEVHEWNKNIEVLVAWSKRLTKEKPNLRVVLMSATMDAHRLATYFEDTGNKPLVIEVPGRTYGVEKLEKPASTVFDETIAYVKRGNNILAFLPGVREIGDLQYALEGKFELDGKNDITVVLPLHGKLSDEEQKAIGRQYPGYKIIPSTNVAQTSLTIPDMDVVIDSGLERRIEIDEEGVQSLRLHAISKADADQRAGRVGRTHPGIYVLTRLDQNTEYVPYINRDDYPTPEILRSDIDRMTLSVAAAGLNLSDLDLFHPIERESLLQARHRLFLLGALDDDGKITQRGRRMNDFPVHPTLSRMLIEADNYSDEVRAYMSATVSAIEVGKLPSYLYTANKNWRELTDEKQSDHLAQLDIFIATQDMSANREFSALGLDVRNVARARELHEKIIRRSALRHGTLVPPTEEQRHEIIECVAAGLIDFVYEASGQGTFIRKIGKHATERAISNRSIVTNGSPNWVVATPYQYAHPTKGERHVIENVTVMNPAILGKVAWKLCTYQAQGGIHWRNGQPVQDQRELFRDVIPTGTWREMPAQASDELDQAIFNYVIEHPGNVQRELRKTKKDLEELRRLGGSRIPQLTQNDLMRLIKQAVPAGSTDPSYVDEHLREIVQQEGLTLDGLVPLGLQQEIRNSSPARVEQDGVTLEVSYSNGKARSRVDMNTILALQKEVLLPNGRQVQLMYEKKSYTLTQLKQNVHSTTHR